MLKLLLFALAGMLGAGGTLAWLASEPEPGSSPRSANARGELQLRLEDLEARFRAAQAEGERAGQYTEEHLRRKLDAYRKGSSSDAPA